MTQNKQQLKMKTHLREIFDRPRRY